MKNKNTDIKYSTTQKQYMSGFPITNVYKALALQILYIHEVVGSGSFKKNDLAFRKLTLAINICS